MMSMLATPQPMQLASGNMTTDEAAQVAAASSAALQDGAVQQRHAILRVMLKQSKALTGVPLDVLLSVQAKLGGIDNHDYAAYGFDVTRVEGAGLDPLHANVKATPGRPSRDAYMLLSHCVHKYLAQQSLGVAGTLGRTVPLSRRLCEVVAELVGAAPDAPCPNADRLAAYYDACQPGYDDKFTPEVSASIGHTVTCNARVVGGEVQSVPHYDAYVLQFDAAQPPTAEDSRSLLRFLLAMMNAANGAAPTADTVESSIPPGMEEVADALLQAPLLALYVYTHVKFTVARASGDGEGPQGLDGVPSPHDLATATPDAVPHHKRWVVFYTFVMAEVAKHMASGIVLQGRPLPALRAAVEEKCVNVRSDVFYLPMMLMPVYALTLLALRDDATVQGDYLVRNQHAHILRLQEVGADAPTQPFALLDGSAVDDFVRDAASGCVGSSRKDAAAAESERDAYARLGLPPRDRIVALLLWGEASYAQAPAADALTPGLFVCAIPRSASRATGTIVAYAVLKGPRAPRGEDLLLASDVVSNALETAKDGLALTAKDVDAVMNPNAAKVKTSDVSRAPMKFATALLRDGVLRLDRLPSRLVRMQVTDAALAASGRDATGARGADGTILFAAAKPAFVAASAPAKRARGGKRKGPGASRRAKRARRPPQTTALDDDLAEAFTQELGAASDDTVPEDEFEPVSDDQDEDYADDGASSSSSSSDDDDGGSSSDDDDGGDGEEFALLAEATEKMLSLVDDRGDIQRPLQPCNHAFAQAKAKFEKQRLLVKDSLTCDHDAFTWTCASCRAVAWKGAALVNVPQTQEQYDAMLREQSAHIALAEAVTVKASLMKISKAIVSSYPVVLHHRKDVALWLDKLRGADLLPTTPTLALQKVPRAVPWPYLDEFVGRIVCDTAGAYLASNRSDSTHAFVFPHISGKDAPSVDDDAVRTAFGVYLDFYMRECMSNEQTSQQHALCQRALTASDMVVKAAPRGNYKTQEAVLPNVLHPFHAEGTKTLSAARDALAASKGMMDACTRDLLRSALSTVVLALVDTRCTALQEKLDAAARDLAQAEAALEKERRAAQEGCSSLRGRVNALLTSLKVDASKHVPDGGDAAALEAGMAEVMDALGAATDADLEAAAEATEAFENVQEQSQRVTRAQKAQAEAKAKQDAAEAEQKNKAASLRARFAAARAK